MTQISGHCLCGAVQYGGDADIKMMANCHCTACRSATGSAYSTIVFVAENELNIEGETASYKHGTDGGNEAEKLFCPKCGSQLFGRNNARAGMIGIRAGTIDQAELVKPAVNVFLSSKIPSTPVDPELKGFDKMPG